MKSDRYNRSISKYPHQQQFQPRKRSIVKRIPRQRHHSLNHQKRHRSNTNTRSDFSIIHVTVRPTTNNIYTCQDKSLHFKDGFYSFSTIQATRHQQNPTNKSSTIAHVVKKSSRLRCPTSVTTIDSYESPIRLQSSHNSWDNEDSAKQLTQKRQQTISNSNNGWPDWTSFENEHHNNNKKNNKKCTRRCTIISVLSAILIVIALVIILPILLVKQNTTITTTPNANVLLRWNTTGITVAGVTGQIGNASNLLTVPFGIVLDFSSTLYIADWSNHRVQKYLKGRSFGQTVAGQAIGSYNSSAAYLHYPGDVAVDSNGNVYVADTFNDRVQLWNNGSTSGTTVCGTGSTGTSPNELNKPYGLTRDEHSGTLYISDNNNNRIVRYLSGSLTGTVVCGGNGAGANSTQVSSPMGVYYDSVTNSVLIANSGANNIVRWPIGASSWTLVAGNMNSVAGNSSTELNTPMDVTLDPMGNVYVADRVNHRIQLFLADQLVGTTIAGITGLHGPNSTMLDTPFSVALDNQLNLYVADTNNQRIQKFLRY